jgi:hypothetical protein
MRTSPPPLLPLLRSQVQGDLLALLYLHPDHEYSLTEAAALIHTSVKTVHTEASRLVGAGYILDARRGNVRLLRAATGTLIAGPLTDLLAVTYGPLPVLTDLLTGVDDIESAFIYGSWAARYLGEPGPVPADVDVLVIGTIDLDLLDKIAQDAEHRLSRPVNIRRVRPAMWTTSPADPFLASVRERPLVELQLEGKYT